MSFIECQSGKILSMESLIAMGVTTTAIEKNGYRTNAYVVRATIRGGDYEDIFMSEKKEECDSRLERIKERMELV